MVPNDNTGWPILIGAMVRVKQPEKLKAYTGIVIDVGPQMVRIKYSKREYLKYAKPEWCTVIPKKAKKVVK